MPIRSPKPTPANHMYPSLPSTYTDACFIGGEFPYTGCRPEGLDLRAALAAAYWVVLDHSLPHECDQNNSRCLYSPIGSTIRSGTEGT